MKEGKEREWAEKVEMVGRLMSREWVVAEEEGKRDEEWVGGNDGKMDESGMSSSWWGRKDRRGAGRGKWWEDGWVENE